MRLVKNSGFDLFRYILLCMTCGGIVGVLIFLFKLAATYVISLSYGIYSLVRAQPVYLPLMLFGGIILGLISAMILKYAPDGRGGGIPTAISVLRGLVSFSWVKSIFAMFTSAMITFFVGVPLGNEGPSVQMGTAVGRGCVRLISRDHHAWDRYIMTGGACAGFAAATGAPLAGIFFAFEEAHRRLSPMIFTASAMTAVTASGVMKFLCRETETSYYIFDLHISEALPFRFSYVAVIVGIICGGLAILLTKCYRMVRRFISVKLSAVPFAVKIAVIFAAVTLIGFVSSDYLSSGHDIVENLFVQSEIWYLLLLCLVIRAVMMLVSNNAGVSGGLFVPTLAFGAIAGSVIGSAMMTLGLFPEQYYPVSVLIGIASVLASFSRTPLMAIAFSLEALGAVNNILPVILGVTAAYVLVDRFEAMPFTDVVIEARAEDAHKGKEASFVDTDMTVMAGSFVVDKEFRDILWPPSCIVTSVHKHTDFDHHQSHLLSPGDTLSFRFKTYNVSETISILESYVGHQTRSAENHNLPSDINDDIPEL